MIRRRLCLLALSMVCAGFTVTRDSVQPLPVRWPSPDITFIIQENGSDDISDGSDLEAIRDALATWNAPACTNVNMIDGGTDSTAQTEAALFNYLDSTNRIGFLETQWILGADGATGIARVVRNQGADPDVWVDGDIVLNGVEHTWATDGRGGAVDVQYVVLHELGHLFGIAHSPHPQATMFHGLPLGYTAGRTLYTNDIDAICYLYPAGTFMCSSDGDCPLLEDTLGSSSDVRTICSGGTCVSGLAGYGDSCFVDSHCSSGICVLGEHLQVSTYAGFCSEACSCSLPNCAGICPGGDGWCDPTSGICILGNDDCRTNADCSAATPGCYPDLDLRWRCSAGCLDDSYCGYNPSAICNLGPPYSAVGRCAIPGALAAGAVCDNPLQCASLNCSGPGVQPHCRSSCLGVSDGTTCDDASLCATGETCRFEVCGNGTLSISCTPPDLCTQTARCDPATGACAYTYNSDSCDDGEICTQGDQCSAGACQSGAPVDCEDGDPCTTDTCVAGTGCNNVFNSAPCDDANPCTTGDQCSGGTCQPGTPVDCSDGDACTTDVCTTGTGLCSNPPIAGCCNVDGECNDSDACTTDVCSGPGGTCSNTGVAGCCNLDGECNDSDACTTDVCSGPGGTCINTDVAGCCNLDGDCDDGSICTVDTCSGPGGSCSYAPITDCCLTSNDCDDGSDCTTDSCDGVSDRCVFVPIGGCCGADTDCADINLCTQDLCDISTGTCSNGAIADCCNTDGDCDDGEACTTDTCSGPGGTCSNTVSASCCNVDGDCNDSDACTTDSCSGPGGTCTNSTILGCCLNAADCDDGSDCTNDECDLGTRQCTHTPISGCCTTDLDCEDVDPCSVESCDGTTGICGYEPVVDCCIMDTDCEDQDDCTLDRCDTANNACVHESVPTCNGDSDVNPGDADSLPPGDGDSQLPESVNKGRTLIVGGCACSSSWADHVTPLGLGAMLAAVFRTRRRRSRSRQSTF